MTWEERNVLTSRLFREEMKALTDARTVPITVIGERVLIGFNAGEYGDALADLK